MKTPSWKITVAALAILSIGAGVGLIFGERSVPEKEQELILRASRIVTTLMEWLPAEAEPTDIVYDGIDGMLEVLDPHSNYLDPRTYQTMRTRQEGSFFGVGIIISRRNGKITVIAPMADTPAARKGLRAGDIISAVEKESTEDLSLNEVVDRVRGPEGSEVNLTIDRPGMDGSFDVAITRARIPTNSVRHTFIIRPGIGYIRLGEFSNTSVREVHEAIAQLRAEGMENLIFDLRNNPGGPLDAAVGVTDVFLRKGDLVVSTKGRTRGSVSSLEAPGDGPRFEGPVVVLVNEGSASASEIVAGAVQDHDRGLVVGEVTWGKGLVQTVFAVRDTGLALTTARYYTPSGRCIQRSYDSYVDYITHRNGATENGGEDDDKSFRTDAGRTVVGGGGVVPDVTVSNRELSELAVRLYGSSAFFRYAIELLKDVPDDQEAAFATAFTANDVAMQRFAAWLLEQEIFDADEVAEMQSDPDVRRDVSTALRVELANATLGLEAGYRVAIADDDQLNEALSLMDEAADFWNTWKNNGDS